MKILYDNIEFDSEEERLFYCYLRELKDVGFVDNFICQPDSFVLSENVEYQWTEKKKTKDVIRNSTILQSHSYTPDFEIEWNEKAYGIFYYELFDGNKLDKIPFVANKPKTSVIEIKPSFDYQNMTRLAIINMKMVYEIYDVYVQKVTPVGKKDCLFAKTFLPQEAMYTAKTKQLKKYKFETISLDTFIERNQK